MGLLDRFKRSRAANDSSEDVLTARVLNGDVDLEVVGESFYQDALWSICGGEKSQRIRYPVTAVLVPQPDNPYDSNAIAVQVQGQIVGHLSRNVCAEYLPGLRALMERFNGPVALRGVIVGGGPERARNLGVWLEHDPADFGVVESASLARSPRSSTGPISGAMRTGFSEAWLTDLDDDSYDLSWFNTLAEDDATAIAQLRVFLETDPDLIDRHFQFAELEARLYRRRNDAAALEEYDEVCRRHDREMDVICKAFITKWGKVPLLETYKQMAIRQQKQGDWEACAWWAERGLALYGDAPARPEAAADLAKRRDRARQKLEAATAGPQPDDRVQVEKARPPSPGIDPHVGSSPPDAIEVLTCSQCGRTFERIRIRGRKPSLCPDCRS